MDDQRYQNAIKLCVIDGRQYDKQEILDLPGCIVALGHGGTIYRNPNVSAAPLPVKNDVTDNNT